MFLQNAGGNVELMRPTPKNDSHLTTALRRIRGHLHLQFRFEPHGSEVEFCLGGVGLRNRFMFHACPLQHRGLDNGWGCE